LRHLCRSRQWRRDRAGRQYRNHMKRKPLSECSWKPKRSIKSSRRRSSRLLQSARCVRLRHGFNCHEAPENELLHHRLSPQELSSVSKIDTIS
jgi:hypothetical protein